MHAMAAPCSLHIGRPSPAGPPLGPAKWRLSALGMLLMLAGFAPTASSQTLEIEQTIQARLESRPDDPAAWRLWGRVLERRGDADAALAAFERALELEPENTAAAADLARVLAAGGQTDRAARYWRQAILLAPESAYAAEARARLDELGLDSGEVIQASFEPDWRDNPTSEFAWRDRRPGERFWARLETGAMYNSNVALAPISRELSADERAGFQIFAAPEAELALPLESAWNAAALFDGYFNLNEGPFDDFNIQHVRPGFLVERPSGWLDLLLVPRLQYNFAYDAFAGRTLGTRHALTASLAAHTEAGHVWFSYWTIDYSGFRDDGEVPAITSLDGWTNTLGLGHERLMGTRWLSRIRGGLDVQLADLEGSSFAYDGVFLYGETRSPFVFGTELDLQLGWGYRDYPRFEFEPGRNENLWSAGVELRKWLSPSCAISGDFHYDRFASANDLFDASRYTAGVFMAYQR